MIDHGFEIRYEKSYRFRPDEVESLYIKHHNNEFFRALIEAYTSYDHIDYDYVNNLRIFFLS